MSLPSGRIISLDQFRGFTVLAMFIVNFVHGMEAVPRIFQHNENWFSLADWIMPGFLFAVGMSFRLTWQKRIQSMSRMKVISGYVRRSLILILVSVTAFGFGAEFSHWSEWTIAGSRDFVAALLKARMWEVLAIIGASQLLLLPVIGRSTRWRMIFIAVLLGLHAGLSQWFNVHFVMAQPNLLDAFWGAADVRAWDGGFFGVINWAAIMLAGTVAYDWLKDGVPVARLKRFLIAGCACMLVGYVLSCFSTLYDIPQGELLPKVAESPVIPQETQGALAFAEPPFTAIASPEQRQINYWMMSKRIVTLPFALFALGFVFIVLAAFVFLCDEKEREFAVLRILGGNALAAFLLHYVVIAALHPLVPRDAPLWFVILGMVIFLVITIGVMRALERQRLYLRL